MTIEEILDFIILNKYTLSKRQLGAIVKEVDLRVERSGAKINNIKISLYYLIKLIIMMV